MNPIKKKIKLTENLYHFTVEAPEIAKAHRPGQFVVLQLDSEWGERIPLTIADSDSAKGTIDLIFQTVGATTRQLGMLNEGEKIAHILGPLGQPTHLEKYDGPVVCVGGGVGTAPLYPIAKALKSMGNEVITILGARDADTQILNKEHGAQADELIICTDDGSAGMKALVTTPLKEICETRKPAAVFAIGPGIMMKFCCETTRPFNIPTTVSLNTIMVDGTGMCGGCRVSVGGETKFVCVDGPEFDGHLVDFETLGRRLGSFRPQEAEKDHKCRLEAALKERG